VSCLHLYDIWWITTTRLWRDYHVWDETGREAQVERDSLVEDLRGMSAEEYLIFSVLAVGCAAGSGQLFVTAERHGVLAQAWLAAVAFGLWSALAAVCFLEAS
jgi:hypothetical protein